MHKQLFRKFLAGILTVTALASFVTINASAEAGAVAYGAGKVGATALNVRAQADTSAPITATLYQGETVVILDGQGTNWYHINHDGTVGYVAAMYIKDVETAKNFTAAGVLTGSDVRLRATPSTTGGILATCPSGTAVSVVGINSGWYKVSYNGNTGYIRSDLMEITSGSQTAMKAVSSAGQQIADFAYTFVGYPYIYGAANPSSGFDCSGLTYYVYNRFGYSISRTASQQFRNNGVSISKDELQPGDLVFFSSNGGRSITHVGLYYGNGMFVNASTSTTGVIFSSLSSAWYTKTYYGAKRILQ